MIEEVSRQVDFISTALYIDRIRKCFTTVIKNNNNRSILRHKMMCPDTYCPSQAFSQPTAFPTAAETKPRSGSPESVHRRFTRATKTGGSRSKVKWKWWKATHGEGEGCFLKEFAGERGGDSRKGLDDWRKASNLPRVYTLIRSAFIFLYSELQYWYVSHTSWCSERFLP